MIGLNEREIIVARAAYCNSVMLQSQSLLHAVVYQLSRRFSEESYSMPNLRGGVHKHTMQLGPQGTLPSRIVILNCSSPLSSKSRGHDPPSPRGFAARFDGW
jgi:hypothetical protein